MNRTFAIQGMHCESCVRKLTEAFTKVPGVTAAHVTLSPPEAHLDLGAAVSLETLQSAARSAGNYSIRENSSSQQSERSPPAPIETPTPKPSLLPLILIVSYILGVCLLIAWSHSSWDLRPIMTNFMAGFFLVFSFFKFLDLRGFVDAYQSYDILARPLRPWGFIYPFLELALGIAYLIHFQPTLTHAVTLILMLLGSVGVLKALLKKNAIRCACLGTALNLPMTTVTLVEDLGMAAMAAIALIFPH